MNPEAILAALSPAQREAATTVAGPLLVKAGPGSGKTRTITHRIAYAAAVGAHDPARTLALTFTTRAAGELRRRLLRLDTSGVTVRTFHSAALRQLRHFWPDAVGGAPARVEADRRPLIAAALDRLQLPGDPDTVAAVQTELDWLKANLHTPVGYPEAGREAAGLDPDVIGRVLAGYEDVKTELGVIDFDDVLLVTIGLLEARSDQRESVRRAFRWITVDEYQDVSPLQQRLLDLWLGERPQLCAVGDAAQAIYQFAGADPTLIATFPARYPGATVVELEETYRCAPAIADAANRLARRIAGSVQLRPVRDPDATASGSVQVLQFPTEISEAAGIADEVAALLARGDRPAGIACLFRTNQQTRALAAELRRRRVPYSTRGSDRFFERAEVKEAVIRFRGETRSHPGASATQAVTAVLVAMGHESDPPDVPAARDRWESLAALAALLGQAGQTAEEALTDLEQRVAEQDPPEVAGVSLLTLHAAKGLEWDTVFVVGATELSLPLVRARTPQGLAEERRLAYVGFTRARGRLVVSYAATGPTGERRAASPYLEVLRGGGDPPELLPAPLPLVTDDGSDHAGEHRPPARCRSCGRALVTGVERVLGRCETCPSTADPQILAALHQWRDRTATDEKVPGHAVLTDVALQALAEQRPDSAERLARIPGLRPDKMRRYGSELLIVMHSAPVGAADPVER